MNRLSAEMALRLFFNRHRGDQASRPVLGSVVGIALSMIPLVVVIFMSDGMIKGITNRFIETGTYHVQLRSFSTLGEQETAALPAELEQLEPVRYVFREHQGMGLAYSGSDQAAASVRGVEPDIYDRDSGFRKYMDFSSGSFDLSDPSSAVIGQEIAVNLGLSVGDEIRILTGKTLSTGKYIPRVSRFTVKGIFSTGYQDLDKMWILIPYDRARRILQDSESFSFLGVKIQDPYDGGEDAARILRDHLSGRWGIYTWQTLNRSQQSNYETTRSLLTFIMALIVLVAVMNISSSMVMLVMENEQEIGVLKSMGIRPSSLSGQYVLTAGLAGGTGSVIGITAGCLIAKNLNLLIGMSEGAVNGAVRLFHLLGQRGETVPVELLNSAYYLEEIPVDIRFHVLAVIFCGTLVLSVAAALIPLRKVRKIRPLDILRKH